MNPRNGALPLDSGTPVGPNEPNPKRNKDLRRGYPVSKPWTPDQNSNDISCVHDMICDDSSAVQAAWFKVAVNRVTIDPRPLPPNDRSKWSRPTYFSGNKTLSANCFGGRGGGGGKKGFWFGVFWRSAHVRGWRDGPCR